MIAHPFRMTPASDSASVPSMLTFSTAGSVKGPLICSVSSAQPSFCREGAHRAREGHDGDVHRIDVPGFPELLDEPVHVDAVLNQVRAGYADGSVHRVGDTPRSIAGKFGARLHDAFVKRFAARDRESSASDNFLATNSARQLGGTARRLISTVPPVSFPNSPKRSGEMR